MTGTLLMAPATWKLSTLQTDCSLGCSIKKEMKSSLKRRQHFYHFPVSAKVLIKPPYRIWQMAFFCSTKFSSNLTVKPQLLPELTAAGACQ
jgi:hypothetical protein